MHPPPHAIFITASTFAKRLCLVLAATCLHTSAAIFNIADGDVAALRNAINTCNTNAQNDTINLAVGGIYIFADADPGTGGLAALPTVRRDGDYPDPFHSVTFNGNYATLARSSAAGTPDFRLLSIANLTGDSTSLVTVSNLTITNGRLSTAGVYGGGLGTSGKVILNDCTISNNAAAYAGGISNGNGSLVMNNCTVSGNTALQGTGGGIWNGVAANTSALVTLNNCTLSGNSASNLGGTIYNQDSDDDGHGDSIVTIHCCTINGGSIYNSGFNSIAKVYLGNTILNNCSLASYNNPGNTATDIFTEGYNLSNGSGNGYLTHSEDFKNTSPGLDPKGLQFNGGATQTIAVVAGSAAIDQGYAFGFGTDQRGFSRTVNNPSIPNNNDGTDIGAFESAADPPQSGVDGFVVNTLADHNDGVAGGNDCTLREALQQTNASSDHNTIVFAPGLTGTITLQGSAGGVLNVFNPVSIIGPGARLLAISGNTNYRIFIVNGAGSSQISGMTIANGWIAGGSGQSADGGGIYNSANLNLTNCTLDFNRSVGGSGSTTGQSGGSGRGGGIYNSGSLAVTGCTFKNNGTTGGFGVNNPPPDDFTLTTGGSGGSASGGAIFNDTGASLTVFNCTFSANNAGAASAGSGTWGGNGGNGVGGGICSLGTTDISSTTFSGNTGFGAAGGAGRSSFFNGVTGFGAGGIGVIGGATTIRSCLIAGNTTPGNFRNDAYGAFVSNGYNLIGKSDGASGFTGMADQTGTAATPLVAQLSALLNNGGPTDTFRLLANSPAIDKGSGSGVTTDQRGVTRPSDSAFFPNASGGDGSDIGAFEVSPSGSTSDGDSDGMADEWEVFYGLTDPNSDADSDARTNRQEYLEGTNPLSAASYVLRIISAQASGGTFTIIFTGTANRTVALERKNTLTDPTWADTGVKVTPTANGNTQISHPGGVTGSRGFYRLHLLP